MALRCIFSGHNWKYWHQDKDTPKERFFRTCQGCGKQEEEVWVGFSEYYWCPVGYTKQDVLDVLFGCGGGE